MTVRKISQVISIAIIMFTTSQISFATDDATQINWICRWTSDSECRDKMPGNYGRYGHCVVKRIIFGEPECTHTRLTAMEDTSNQEKTICRWTSDFECRDLMPGIYAFGSCVVKRITFGEPECAAIKHRE